MYTDTAWQMNKLGYNIGAQTLDNPDDRHTITWVGPHGAGYL
jgi:hypothetical protein